MLRVERDDSEKALNPIRRVGGGIRAEIEEDMEMMILDVKRAHLYAKALRRLFIEMPKEDPRWAECHGVAELLMSLYGTQDAAANWEAEYSQKLEQWGYAKGKASPCLFHNA